MQKTMKRFLIWIIATMIICAVPATTAWAAGTAGAEIPGGFVMGIDGKTVIAGHVRGTLDDGTKNVPIEGYTVKLFAGAVSEDDMASGSVPFLKQTDTDSSGYYRFLISEDELTEWGVREFSVYISKDGWNSKGYSQAEHYIWEWPTINLEVESEVTLHVGDAFDPQDYVIAAEYEDYSDPKPLGDLLKHSGEVDTSKPGQYKVTYSAMVQQRGLYIEDRDGEWEFDLDKMIWAPREPHDSRQAVKTLLVTVLPNESTVTAVYQDQDGNQIADPVSSTGAVGDPYKTEAKEIVGYKLIEAPDNAEGAYAEADIQVVYVYEKVPVAIDETPNENDPAAKALASAGDTATAPVAVALGALATCVLAVAARKLRKQS